MNKSFSLNKLVAYLDQSLKTKQFSDWPTAYNGLQVENSGHVTRIAVAVDAHEKVIDAAIHQQADFLLVHHGIFWQSIAHLTGFRYRKIKKALDHNLAIYSSHLPLDAHPHWGNNILLAKALGIKKSEPFFAEKGQYVGRKVKGQWKREELLKKWNSLFSKNHFIAAGPENIRQIGIITGGAGNDLAKVAAAGIDTFITGEGHHWTYGLAWELGINLLYGGHYATETFGVRALGQHLTQKFAIPHVYLDFPSGL